MFEAYVSQNINQQSQRTTDEFIFSYFPQNIKYAFLANDLLQHRLKVHAVESTLNVYCLVIFISVFAIVLTRVGLYILSRNPMTSCDLKAATYFRFELLSIAQQSGRL